MPSVNNGGLWMQTLSNNTYELIRLNSAYMTNLATITGISVSLLNSYFDDQRSSQIELQYGFMYTVNRYTHAMTSKYGATWGMSHKYGYGWVLEIAFNRQQGTTINDGVSWPDGDPHFRALHMPKSASPFTLEERAFQQSLMPQIHVAHNRTARHAGCIGSFTFDVPYVGAFMGCMDMATNVRAFWTEYGERHSPCLEWCCDPARNSARVIGNSPFWRPPIPSVAMLGITTCCTTGCTPLC